MAKIAAQSGWSWSREYILDRLYLPQGLAMIHWHRRIGCGLLTVPLAPPLAPVSDEEIAASLADTAPEP